MTPLQLEESLDTLIMEEAPGILGITPDGEIPALVCMNAIRVRVEMEVEDSDCVDEETVRTAVRRGLQLYMEDEEEFNEEDD